MEGECTLAPLTALCQGPSSRSAAPTACSTFLRILRSAKAPVTAASIADELEVTVRTVYRDVATLLPRAGAPRG